MWWLRRIEGLGSRSLDSRFYVGFLVRVLRFRGSEGIAFFMAGEAGRRRPALHCMIGDPLASQLTLVTLRVLLIKCRWLHPA